MFFDTGTFWVFPLTYFYIPKSARAYLFPNLSKFITFAAAPSVLTPFHLSATKSRFLLWGSLRTGACAVQCALRAKRLLPRTRRLAALARSSHRAAPFRYGKFRVPETCPRPPVPAARVFLVLLCVFCAVLCSFFSWGILKLGVGTSSRAP